MCVCVLFFCFYLIIPFNRGLVEYCPYRCQIGISFFVVGFIQIWMKVYFLYVVFIFFLFTNQRNRQSVQFREITIAKQCLLGCFLFLSCSFSKWTVDRKLTKSTDGRGLFQTNFTQILLKCNLNTTVCINFVILYIKMKLDLCVLAHWKHINPIDLWKYNGKSNDDNRRTKKV